MLSKKTRYSILSVTKLAREYGKGPVLISEIAKSELIPQRFLESILLELKRIGILGSKLGKNGGYYLVKSPETIKLVDIVRHFEGAVALMPCTSEKHYIPCEHCKDENICGIKKVFKSVRDKTYEILENTSFADLIELEKKQFDAIS